MSRTWNHRKAKSSPAPRKRQKRATVPRRKAGKNTEQLLVNREAVVIREYMLSQEA